MYQSIKKRSQSLPKLRRAEFMARSQSLAKLFHQQGEPHRPLKQEILSTQQQHIPDLQSRNRQKVQDILLRSKSIIQQNKQKVDVARRFRIMKRKSAAGPFVTGVDIYKQEQQDIKPHIDDHVITIPIQNQQNDQQSLNQLMSQKYDDLTELRRMIKKTSKNLGAYKQQTLGIKKNVLKLADKYERSPIQFIGRSKFFQKVEGIHHQEV